jgi:methionine synthase II (cobalamin-independent)
LLCQPYRGAFSRPPSIIDLHREPIEARPLSVANARAIAVPDVDSHVVVIAARGQESRSGAAARHIEAERAAIKRFRAGDVPDAKMNMADAQSIRCTEIRRRRGIDLADDRVDATNAALSGIPVERVRFHTCYGINEGPRIHESNLPEIIEYVLKINAGSFSFEAANPRHEHEYHLFERVKLPEGKVLCPGVITHASNIVEHPEWIAERLIRFAKLVGRENVMAGADCGFSSQALYKTEVHPTVVWEKFKAMRQGADLATRRLWN